MKKAELSIAFRKISEIMRENRQYLIELDQRNGDGDLGISMDNGFRAVAAMLDKTQEEDLGRIFMESSKAFNAAAPSSLGTILSIGMKGMAKALKGRSECSLAEMAEAMEIGITNIMEKAESKAGEKTILDTLIPAVQAMKENIGDEQLFKKVYEAAEAGAESTRNMKSVHGRAAYYGDKSIGLVDGGAIAGALIFKALQ